MHLDYPVCGNNSVCFKEPGKSAGQQAQYPAVDGNIKRLLGHIAVMINQFADPGQTGS